jgi:hypothetical protein
LGKFPFALGLKDRIGDQFDAVLTPASSVSEPLREQAFRLFEPDMFRPLDVSPDERDQLPKGRKAALAPATEMIKHFRSKAAIVESLRRDADAFEVAQLFFAGRFPLPGNARSVCPQLQLR